MTARDNLDLRTITEPVYAWKNHSRFVEIVPVQTGWLVLWGKYERMGAEKHIYGQRVYRDEVGVRRRLADAVLAFTNKPSEAQDALTLLDRRGLPRHRPVPLPEPL